MDTAETRIFHKLRRIGYDMRLYVTYFEVSVHHRQALMVPIIFGARGGKEMLGAS